MALSFVKQLQSRHEMSLLAFLSVKNKREATKTGAARNRLSLSKRRRTDGQTLADNGQPAPPPPAADADAVCARPASSFADPIVLSDDDEEEAAQPTSGESCSSKYANDEKASDDINTSNSNSGAGVISLDAESSSECSVCHPASAPDQPRDLVPRRSSSECDTSALGCAQGASCPAQVSHPVVLPVAPRPPHESSLS